MNKQKILNYALLIVFIIFVSNNAYSTMYPILEKDMMIEMQEKAKNVDMEKYKSKIKEDLLSMRGVVLPPATKDTAYYVDMSYTLDIDITDEHGKVIYPEGYTFNPVHYMAVSMPALVVFNVCSKPEREKVKELLPLLGENYMLISAGCAYRDVNEYGKDFDARLFMLNDDLAKRFQIKQTISIVTIEKEDSYALVRVFKTNS